MNQLQADGLSPRGSKGHRRTRSATNKEDLCGGLGGGSKTKTSITPVPSAQCGRFFNDLPARPAAPSTLPRSSLSSTPSSASKGHPRQQQQQQLTKHAPTVRLAAMMAVALVVLLGTRAAVASPRSARSFLRAVEKAPEVSERCAGRLEQRRGLGVHHEQCAAVLPASVVESGSPSWLVSVHVDRAPSSVQPLKRLRGAPAVRRSLPHQYYVRAMEAALHSIAVAEPGASVDVAVFSEGQWGGIVDEMGMPVDWHVPTDTCDDLGLHCTQNVVLLNEPKSSVADYLECIATSDVFVGSEGKLSRAAAVLSNHVKVLTDRWETDEDEMMVALNPATTIAGMPAPQRKLLKTLVSEYHECSSAFKA